MTTPFEVGQKVYRVVKHGRYTPPTYEPDEVAFVRTISHTAWRGMTKYEVKRQRVRLKDGPSYGDMSATKTHVLTIEEYERLRPQAEEASRKAQAAQELTARRKAAYVREVFWRLSGRILNDDGVELALGLFGLPYRWEFVCFKCGQEHYSSGISRAGCEQARTVHDLVPGDEPEA